MRMMYDPEANVQFDDRDYVGYYAELEKQIMKLTSDNGEEVEEEEDGFLAGTKIRSSVSSARRNCNNTVKAASSPCFSYWEKDNSTSVPTWLLNLWNSGGNINGGTGVFIPQFVDSRRKYNSGRTSNQRRLNKQVWRAR